MVETIVKKTTPSQNRREAYFKHKSKEKGESLSAKCKKSIKVEQCGTPPYVNIGKGLAIPIPVLNKEVYLDTDTTSYLKECTEGTNVGKPVLK